MLKKCMASRRKASIMPRQHNKRNTTRCQQQTACRPQPKNTLSLSKREMLRAGQLHWLTAPSGGPPHAIIFSTLPVACNQFCSTTYRREMQARNALLLHWLYSNSGIATGCFLTSRDREHVPRQCRRTTGQCRERTGWSPESTTTIW